MYIHTHIIYIYILSLPRHIHLHGVDQTSQPSQPAGPKTRHLLAPGKPVSTRPRWWCWGLEFWWSWLV